METNGLREARLIVPWHDSQGYSRPEILSEVQRLLVEAFGGYTGTAGTNAYNMPTGPLTEAIFIFDVAIPPGGGLKKLRAIAMYVAEALDQESVYLRRPGNTIEFVKKPNNIYRDSGINRPRI